MDDKDLISQYIEDIKKDADTLEDQADTANEAIRFVDVKGGQWEGDFGDKYGENRVKMQFDITSEHVQDFISEWNQNRLGVEYKADDDATTEDDADQINGIYRADFRQNDGKLAVDQCVDEIAKCGYGAFGLTTRYEDEEDPENELQRIAFFPIVNAYNHVVWDSNATRIDKADANHCTLIMEVELEKFQDDHPDLKPDSAYIPADRRYNNTSIGNKKTIYIAKRYEVRIDTVDVYVYHNLQTGEIETYEEEKHKEVESQLKQSEAHRFSRKRKINRRSVWVSKFTGSDFIEKPRRIAGKWIPIIPGYAYRSYIDGQEQYHGLVQKRMDGQRLFNMLMNQIAENAATGGQEVPIFDPDQMNNKDIQSQWADKNNKPYLLAKALRDHDGKILQAGPIGYSKPSVLDQNTSVLLEQVISFMQRGRGPKEEILESEMSGKAVNALIRRLNMATQDIQDNIANMLEHAGKVYKDMFFEVYDTPRSLNTIGRDGTEGRVQLFKTEYNKEEGVFEEVNQLSRKKFRVYADVGPQYESVRDQTVDELRSLLAELNQTEDGKQYTSAVLSTILENLSGVGLGPLKKLNRNIMLSQGLVEPQNDEEEAFLAQIQQPQQDPNQGLIAAATEQQLAEARNLDASTVQKIADAEKKAAETAEIRQELADVTDIREIRKQFLNQAGQGL